MTITKMMVNISEVMLEVIVWMIPQPPGSSGHLLSRADFICIDIKNNSSVTIQKGGFDFKHVLLLTINRIVSPLKIWGYDGHLFDPHRKLPLKCSQVMDCAEPE